MEVEMWKLEGGFKTTYSDFAPRLKTECNGGIRTPGVSSSLILRRLTWSWKQAKLDLVLYNTICSGKC
jgi:hypothetical protein